MPTPSFVSPITYSFINWFLIGLPKLLMKSLILYLYTLHCITLTPGISSLTLLLSFQPFSRLPSVPPSPSIAFLFRFPVGHHGYYVFVIARAITCPEDSPTPPRPFGSQSLCFYMSAEDLNSVLIPEQWVLVPMELETWTRVFIPAQRVLMPMETSAALI